MRGSTGRGGRRRHNYCRQQRMRRALLCLGLLLGLLAACVVILVRRNSVPQDYYGESATQDSKGRAGLARLNNQPSRVGSGRLVYPYSVVPGGVQDPTELQRVSTQDRVVSSHFAGFDYRRAQVIQLPHPKEVYLSYRVRDRVFWTSKKVRLRAGEKLITDGKITARTRCANQVSETKQAMVSPQEPPAEKFVHPIGEDELAMLHFPSTFDSALLGRPQMPDPGPVSPPSSLFPLVGGWVPGGIAPPPIPLGACETADHEKLEKVADNEKNEKPCPPSVPGPPPATVPEPGTILMVSSGLAGVYLRYRKKAQGN